MSVRSLAADVKAAITAQGVTVLDYDDAQDLQNGDEVDFGGVVLDTLPPIHVLVSLSRRFGGNPRVSAHKTVSGWRLTTTAVGTTVDEARWAAEKVARLEFARITATGYDLSPLMFEVENAPEPDDGFYSGATSWTFTSTSTS